MNFTQEKKINIGGEKRLIKFGTNASRIFSEMQDLSLSDIQSINFQNVKVGQLVDMIYAGLAAGEIKEKGHSSLEDVSFSKFDVGDWIDNTDDETVEEIYSLIQAPVEEGSKKKEESP